MRKFLALLLLPIVLVAGLLSVILISVSEPAPAGLQRAACVGSTGEFGEDAVPNGWGPLVSAAADTAGVPASILAAQLEAESGWNPNAQSPVGAQGLAQFMPGTWATYGDGGSPLDPEDAIAAQGRYMAALLKELAPVAASSSEDPVKLALAGYNAGPGAVQQYDGVPPYGETTNYITKIMATAQEKYGQSCPASSGTANGVQIGDLAGEWSHPLPGSEFLSGYGPRPTPAGTLNIGNNFHYGMDFATAGPGGQVLAVMDMKIYIAREMDGSSGTWVAGVSTDGKLTATYSHLVSGSILVQEGDTVSAGTPLATEGATGNVTGQHLHFELHEGQPGDPRLGLSTPIDPTPILKGKGVL